MQFGKRTILLVEDEESITTPLVEALHREGFDTVVSATASESLEAFERASPDLILLDVMLPDGSGFEVCRELRARSRVPIIMLTARGEEADRVAGLELGADDYVVKPARASSSPGCGRCSAAPPRRKSRGRRRHRDRRRPHRPPTRTASFRGEELELSRKEFDLLRLLVDNAGSVVTRERLIDEVWDTNWFGSTKTLDVHVSGLRKARDDPNDARYIHTVRGVGFRFAAADER